jgi:DNA-binding SARP family transcriptional activator
MTRPGRRGDVGEAEGLVRRGERALYGVGDLAAARRWFERACVAAERDGDANALAEAALGLGGLWVHEHREDGARAKMASWQRLALAGDGVRPELAARLRARIAAEEDYRAGRHSEVLATLPQARLGDDPATLAMTLGLIHHCALGPEHGRLRAALAEELQLTAARTPSHPQGRTHTLMGMLWATVDLFLDGDPHAERSLGQLRETLEPEEHLAIGYVVRAMAVMLAIRAGDLGRAEELAADCARSGGICGDADAEGWYRGQLLAIRWFQGRAGEALPTVRSQQHSTDLSRLDDSLVAALAVTAASGGDRLLAAGALARLGRGDLRRVRSSSVWLVTICGAIEAAALLGDADTCAAAYDLLLPHARLPVMASLAMACFGSAEQALGVAALTMGRLDPAVQHLRGAVRANLALGHWPAHALSRHRLADALTARGGPGDHDAAATERAVAESEATRLAMVLPPAGGTPLPPVRSESRGSTLLHRSALPRRPAGSDTQVRLLGPVDVRVGDTIRAVSGTRRRTVLAVLALHGSEAVTADRLIDIVWGDQAPRTAPNTIQAHLSFLRRVIGSPTAILARSGGYLLDLGAEATDLAAAEGLIRRGTRAAEPRDAVRYLQDAVALWRGQPLLDVAGPAWLSDQAERLNHLFLAAHRALAQARLALGHYAQLATDLEPLTREHPLHEQIHQQLMLGLYRDGLPSEALGVYERLRTSLREELGIDPSRPLRDLHAAIVRQEDASAQPCPAVSGAG